MNVQNQDILNQIHENVRCAQQLGDDRTAAVLQVLAKIWSKLCLIEEQLEIDL